MAVEVTGVLPLEGLMDHLLVEGPMDTPMLGDSPLELQEDHMVVPPQGAPIVSHLQIPMVPSSPGLMDRVSRILGSGSSAQVLCYPWPILSFLWVCRHPDLWHRSILLPASACISRMRCQLTWLWEISSAHKHFYCLLMLIYSCLCVSCYRWAAEFLLHVSFHSGIQAEGASPIWNMLFLWQRKGN